MKLIKLLIALPLVAATFTANAQSEITGEVTLDVQAKNVISAAIGNQTDSIVRMGTVKDSDIGGAVTSKVRADNVISAAIGNKTSSKVRMASVD